MTRLDRVGEDRGLVAAAGALLAAAEQEVLAEAERAGHVGERAHVDDGGAQLGQLALGQVGVVAVQRVGDDEAEHRVAEELQPLVVGQAAVLVGVGAVRQGTQKQRLVDRLADAPRAGGGRAQSTGRCGALVAVGGLRSLTRDGRGQPWCSVRSATP